MESSEPDHNHKHNISQDFLAKAIGKEFLIKSFEVTPGSKDGDNFMSVMHAIDVKLECLKTSEEITRHLLIKCYPSHPGRQDLINKMNVFVKELDVYRKWIPELKNFQTQVIGLKEAMKLPFATFVHGQCIDFESDEEVKNIREVLSPLDNYIIMEDLRKTWGFRMAERRNGLDLDHLQLAISELAKIHALSWAYKHHVEKDIVKKIPSLQVNSAVLEEVMGKLAKSNCDLAIALIDQKLGIGNELSEAVIRFKGIAPDIFNSFMVKGDSKQLEQLLRIPVEEKSGSKSLEEEKPWKVIIHGDSWTNNMLFRYDDKTGKPVEVVLVDLQLVGEASIINDLAYIMFTSTRSALREAHLDKVLQLYYDVFNDVCKTMKTETLPDFDMDSLKRRFHRSKLYGLFMALLCYPMTLKDDDESQNMDNVDKDKDIIEMFTEFSNSGNNSKAILTDRFMEITKELFDQGVI